MQQQTLQTRCGSLGCWAFALLLMLTPVTSTVMAQAYPLHDDGSRLMGRATYHQIMPGETLARIAQRYDVGFLALLAANPGVDPFLPRVGYVLTIPNQFILPDVPRKGIVINLAELRLYYFDPDAAIVHVFPVGIGRVGRDTPEMVTKISQKRANPTWTPPQSIRRDYLAKGIELPQVVPSGPDNPLGLFALRLAYGNGEYLIHGTNKDFGIGLRVSAGCIRMSPADIEWLFEQVAKGTPVRVINQPIKMTLEPDRRVYLEAHEPLTRSDGSQEALRIPRDLRWWLDEVGESSTKAKAVIAAQNGVPVEIAAPD